MSESLPQRGGGAVRLQQGRATLSSVAHLAGVSKQTVSNVLNAPHLVREETARKVADAIRDLGYRPHRAAQQLRTRRSRLLGLRVVELSSGDKVFDRLLHALTEAADERDYRIMLYTAADDEAEMSAYEELLERWDIDGVVLTTTHPGDLRIGYLNRSKLPCVCFGRPWDSVGNHAWVDVDGAAGTRAATEHLIAAGHARIGFLGWTDSAGVGDDRMAGWAAAIQGAGLELLPPARSINDVGPGRAAAAELLDRASPTALVCVSDAIGIGALAELDSRGMVAGKDVSVFGFDDTELAEVSGLSSISQPLRGVAWHCVRLVVEQIERPHRPDALAEQVLLRPELKFRSSTGPPAPAP